MMLYCGVCVAVYTVCKSAVPDDPTHCKRHVHIYPLLLLHVLLTAQINPKLAAELGLAGSNMSQPVRKYR